jgi:catechol 2,3-dioxygenase-like lactoylglutathione lyase family enzyme
MNSPTSAASLSLHGVDHTARPTWKLRETVEFYRDILGLPLVHVVSARGWGTENHPDFIHFFFDSGNESTIAFFYYLGSSLPANMTGRPGRQPVPEDHVFDATHTAWRVGTAEQLQAWKSRLQERGVTVSAETAHETIESIYFRDPNGYFIEITRKLRELQPRDARDAALTLQAAMAWEAAVLETATGEHPIDDVWRRKGELVASAVASIGGLQ